jgi:hypothetical protein
MAEWATKHGRWRSPTLRRSLIVLVRRTRFGLLSLLLAWVLLTPSSASAAITTGLIVQDISDPDISAGRDGEASTSQAGAPRPPEPPGKTARAGGVQRQGSVVAVFQDPADPLIVIAVESGYVTVRLRCGTLCPRIHLGDYVVVEGQRRSEAVLDAVDVWVATP